MRGLLRPRLAHALVIGMVFFAGLGAWPWLMPPATTPALAKPSPAEPVAALPDVAPLGSFSAIAARPLFSPSRRAVVIKPAAPPPVAAPDTKYRLVGVMIVGERRRALVMDGQRAIELGEGDQVDQWLVQRIEMNRVELSSPSGDAVLKLKQASGSDSRTPAPGSKPAAQP